MPTMTRDHFNGYVYGQRQDLDRVSGRELDDLAEQVFNISRQRDDFFSVGMDGPNRIAYDRWESDEIFRRRIMHIIGNPASYPMTIVDKPLTAMVEARTEPKRMTRWDRLLNPIL
jgi:hypothetical protein